MKIKMRTKKTIVEYGEEEFDIAEILKKYAFCIRKFDLGICPYGKSLKRELVFFYQSNCMMERFHNIPLTEKQFNEITIEDEEDVISFYKQYPQYFEDPSFLQFFTIEIK